MRAVKVWQRRIARWRSRSLLPAGHYEKKEAAVLAWLLSRNLQEVQNCGVSRSPTRKVKSKKSPAFIANQHSSHGWREKGKQRLGHKLTTLRFSEHVHSRWICAPLFVARQTWGAHVSLYFVLKKTELNCIFFVCTYPLNELHCALFNPTVHFIKIVLISCYQEMRLFQKTWFICI